MRLRNTPNINIRPPLNLKTLTQIENLLYNLNQWKYTYLRVSNNERAVNYCLFMIEEHEKLIGSYPIEWLNAVRLIIPLRY